MRATLVLPVALTIACSSSTVPVSAINGRWEASGAVGTGVQAFQLSLAETNGSISGTATLSYLDANRQSLILHVTGRTGLDGSPCLPEQPNVCHARFEFKAGDASGDTIYFIGQLKSQNVMFGDVQATAGLPYRNVDGLGLEFDRFFAPEVSN